MPAALVTSQDHLKTQKLSTTISNKRGRPDPAMCTLWVHFLGVQMYTVDRVHLSSEHRILISLIRILNWAKEVLAIPQPSHSDP